MDIADYLSPLEFMMEIWKIPSCVDWSDPLVWAAACGWKGYVSGSGIHPGFRHMQWMVLKALCCKVFLASKIQPIVILEFPSTGHFSKTTLAGLPSVHLPLNQNHLFLPLHFLPRAQLTCQLLPCPCMLHSAESSAFSSQHCHRDTENQTYYKNTGSSRVKHNIANFGLYFPVCLVELYWTEYSKR